MSGVEIDFVIDDAKAQQLYRDLMELPKRISLKVIQRALYKGAKVLTKATRQNIRADDLIDTGTLLKSIGVAGVKRTDSYVIIRVGIIKYNAAQKAKRAAKGLNASAWYGKFSEDGTKYIQARHYLQRAGAAQGQAFVDAVRAAMPELIDKEISKLHK